MDLNSLGLELESIKFVSKLISDGCDITHLNLFNNKMTDIGAIELGKALWFSETLIHVDISCNGIYDKGAIEFLKCLKYNNSIVSLSMASHFGTKNWLTSWSI